MNIYIYIFCTDEPKHGEKLVSADEYIYIYIFIHISPNAGSMWQLKEEMI